MKLKEGTLMTNHLNAFQSIVNQLVSMRMIMDDEMQASLLLCSLLDSQATFVVIISNSVSNGALSMELVKGNLLNEETRKKAYDKKKSTIPHHRKQRKKQEQKTEGHEKFEGRSQSKDKIKCFHCGKEGHMKRNCRIWKREQNRQNKKKENDKNITTIMFNSDEVLVLSNEFLHVDEQ